MCQIQAWICAKLSSWILMPCAKFLPLLFFHFFFLFFFLWHILSFHSVLVSLLYPENRSCYHTQFRFRASCIQWLKTWLWQWSTYYMENDGRVDFKSAILRSILPLNAKRNENSSFSDFSSWLADEFLFTSAFSLLLPAQAHWIFSFSFYRIVRKWQKIPNKGRI